MKPKKLESLPYCPSHDRFECGLCEGHFEGSFEELLSHYERVSVDFVDGEPIAVWVSTETRVDATWVQEWAVGWRRAKSGAWLKWSKKLPLGGYAHS